MRRKQNEEIKVYRGKQRKITENSKGLNEKKIENETRIGMKENRKFIIRAMNS